MGAERSTILCVGFLVISLYCVYLYREGKRHQQAIRVAQQKAASRKKYKVPEGLPLPSYMGSIDEGLNDQLNASDESAPTQLPDRQTQEPC